MIKISSKEAKKVNDQQLRKTLPTLLTPPNLNIWDRNIIKDRNDYHQIKFKRNAPEIEREKFTKVVDALTEYKEAQERFWKNKQQRNNNFY
jgi:hypothetical protein